VNAIHKKKQFGIPTVIENRLQDYGSLVEITELTKMHENGEMDVRTKGLTVFRILEIIKEVPDKLYSGGYCKLSRNKRRRKQGINEKS